VGHHRLRQASTTSPPPTCGRSWSPAGRALGHAGSGRAATTSKSSHARGPMVLLLDACGTAAKPTRPSLLRPGERSSAWCLRIRQARITLTAMRPDDARPQSEPMTLDEMGDICLGDLEEADDRLPEGQIAPDLPGLAADWIPHGVRAGRVVRVGEAVVATRAGLDWLNRDRSASSASEDGSVVVIVESRGPRARPSIWSRLKR
jgi:hypothetical protein